MKDECCDNCRYSRDDMGLEHFLSCHRRAPEPYSFYRYYIGELLRTIAWEACEGDENNRDVQTEATETVASVGWPEVSKGDWCGEFELRSA